jgi:hypothetical protein
MDELTRQPDRCVNQSHLKRKMIHQLNQSVRSRFARITKRLFMKCSAQDNPLNDPKCILYFHFVVSDIQVTLNFFEQL